MAKKKANYPRTGNGQTKKGISAKKGIGQKQQRPKQTAAQKRSRRENTAVNLRRAENIELLF